MQDLTDSLSFEIIRPEEFWDSSLRLPRLAIERVQLALSSLARDLKGLRAEVRLKRAKDEEYRDLLLQQEIQLLKKETMALALQNQSLGNEMTRLKASSDEIQSFMRQNLPKIFSKEVEQLFSKQVRTEERILNLQEGFEAQMHRMVQLAKQNQDIQKRVFLCEEFERSLDQDSKSRASFVSGQLLSCREELQLLHEHVQGGARLQKIELKLKENQLASQNLTSDMFVELKALIQNISGELDKLASEKVSKRDIQTLEGARREEKNIRIDNSILEQLQLAQRELRLGTEERDSAIQALTNDMAKVTKLLLSKPGPEQFQHLKLMKCDRADVELLWAEVRRVKEQKVQLRQFLQRMGEQKQINEVMFRESIEGKWLWNSDATKAGLVPWDAQIVNSRPEIYRWEKGQPVIKVSASGVYQVQAGFFAPRKPQVQFMVDGRPVILQTNAPSYVIQHSNGRAKENKHPSGEVTGLSICDFILLAGDSSICMKYEGAMAEGFLLLKRL